jgi:hypothetical protein
LERITARQNPVSEQPFRASAAYGPSVPSPQREEAEDVAGEAETRERSR